MTPKFVDEDALELRLLQFARDMNLIGQEHYDQECARLEVEKTLEAPKLSGPSKAKN